MDRKKLHRSFWFSIWPKVILTLLLFVPAVAQRPYDPANTSAVVAAVLSRPLINGLPALLPVAKLALLLAVILPVVSGRFSKRLLMGYYGFFLIPVAIFQNIAVTAEYNLAWLVGNTLLQLVVAAYCLYDFFEHKSEIRSGDFSKGRAWVIPLMLLAFLMPYGVDASGNIQPVFSGAVIWNEAAVTYCMITPVVLGMLLMYSKGVCKPVLSIIAYAGLLFGLLNMMTWFVMQSQNWWMGVLHLPLLILSISGLLTAREKTAPAPALSGSLP
ncbi:hypothetical protein LARV_00271 [Longilinea arvoryzae]|uniref:Uncharacterized protein n=1 Tax=Longilinea arvoryzae TaxID=360412 RepID=A0A0S7B6C3_9CHLR|nr:hypothetical protein [Longilinea arvoryzae]GAP12535.1 hypothetical protein LARV_00271 [Longilinea arvoryzae]